MEEPQQRRSRLLAGGHYQRLPCTSSLAMASFDFVDIMSCIMTEEPRGGVASVCQSCDGTGEVAIAIALCAQQSSEYCADWALSKQNTGDQRY